MLRYFISSFTLAVVTGIGVWCISWIVISVLALLGVKAKCNNHYLKRELKDRNQIIASLLNSRNR